MAIRTVLNEEHDDVEITVLSCKVEWIEPFIVLFINNMFGVVRFLRVGRRRDSQDFGHDFEIFGTSVRGQCTKSLHETKSYHRFPKR